MKKSLLIIISFCIGNWNAIAQITITTADMPSPPKVIYMANDTLPTISVGIADTNQTWNMTALVQHTVDTSTVMPYSMAPNAVFSSANLAIKQGYQNFYGYALNSSSDMTLIGAGGVIDIEGSLTPINQINTPAEILMNFPASYDSSFTNNYFTNAKFYYGQIVQGLMVDSVHQKSGVQKNVMIDAWGTLTTPLAGGPYNVLRIKETKISHDTTRVYIAMFGAWTDVANASDSTVTYSWWANGIGAALATATMDSSGAVRNVEWLTAPPAYPPLSGVVSSANETCPGLCDGSAFVTANWGTPPYSYSWNTNPVQNSDSATALCNGTYIVTITDSVLATATATVTINSPAAPVITASGTTLSTNYVATGFQWYLDGVIITGATSSSYTVTQNGNYTISVSYGSGCSDTSALFNFNTIGINESAVNSSITIYPNPANNQITIKFDASTPLLSTKQDILLIDILNELGQSIKKVGLKQLVIGKNEMTIDVADLPGGIYFIQIQTNNTTVNKKFIKQ